MKMEDTEEQRKEKTCKYSYQTGKKQICAKSPPWPG